MAGRQIMAGTGTGIETAGVGATVEMVGIGTVGGWLGWLALGMALKCLGMRLVLLKWIELAGVVVHVCMCG